jgi:hypothetical protein
MKKIILYLSSLTVAFASTPAWYLSPPPDDVTAFYAAAYAATAKEAKNEALSQIASQLNVSVSSSFYKDATQMTSGDKEYYEKFVKSTVKTETQNIRFNNYQIVKSDSDNGQTYVLIKIDKKVFLTENMDKFKELNSKIEALYEGLESEPLGKRISDAKKVNDHIRSAKYLIDIISSVDSSMLNRSNYWTKYTIYEQEIADLNNKISFYFDYKGSDYNFVADAFRNVLGKNKIKIANRIEDDPSLLVLKIGGNVQIEKDYGNFTVTANLLFSAYDNSGKTITTAKKDFKATSVKDYKDAFYNAQGKLEGILEDEGYLRVIGLD